LQHSRYIDLVSFDGKTPTGAIRILFAAFDKIFQTLEHSHRRLLVRSLCRMFYQKKKHQTSTLVLFAQTLNETDDEEIQARLRSIFLNEKIIVRVLLSFAGLFMSNLLHTPKTLDTIFTLAQRVHPSDPSPLSLQEVISSATKTTQSYLLRYLAGYFIPVAEQVLARFVGDRFDAEVPINSVTRHLDDGGLFSSPVAPVVQTAAQAKEILLRQIEIVCPNTDIRSKFEQMAAEFVRACAVHHEMTLVRFVLREMG